MIGFPLQNEKILSRLLAALDRQIELLDARRGRMKSLFDAIVGRDDATMETILSQMERDQAQQFAADGELAAAKAALADELEMPPGQVTLTRLADLLHGPDALDVLDRQQRLRELAAALRKQHLQTSYLLSECARINRLLLESFCGESVTTYGAGGVREWRPTGGLMNTEL